MKLIYTSDEVKNIVLAHVNVVFGTDFNSIEFDGYSPFKNATLEFVPPKPVADIYTAENV